MRRRKHLLQRFADHVLTGSARQHFSAGILVFNPEIDDVVTRVAHRAHDEAPVEARFRRGLELLRNARCLLARLFERIGQRRELPPHQINADHHEREQQHDRVAEAIGERLIKLGGVDLDDHAESGESDRTVGRPHAAAGTAEVNSNIAAMVANPEDLLHGREGASVTDTYTAARAIEMYRNTAPTGSKGLQDVNPKGGK